MSKREIYEELPTFTGGEDDPEERTETPAPPRKKSGGRDEGSSGAAKSPRPGKAPASGRTRGGDKR